ncbi:hypothetical protein BLNAU_20379 [Blattamonas nauphoetae]|uniref:Uncharacterized protein n=1 Tax=Blattamonas nauphoetae TaxID=2049346 RepID=A0ABQ9WYV2_9EUKA|nr:hypothetical protein BLNAU_20379 [Blattamonas nauphoetae]
MNSEKSFLKNVLDYFGDSGCTCISKHPTDRNAVIANLSQASTQLLSDIKSTERRYLTISPTIVGSLVALLASDVDSVKETLLSILATLMGITPEYVNFLLHNCDPTPPCWADQTLLKEFRRLPSIQNNLAQSIERLLMSIPYESPLRASLLLFLPQYARRTTIIEHLHLYNNSKYQIFLTTSLRRILLRLTQFLSDKDTSSILQIILSQYRGSMDSENNVLRNSVQEEVELLLPDQSRPSHLRIEAIRSYLLTLSIRNFDRFFHNEFWACRYGQRNFVSDTFIVIPRCESPKNCDFCFWLLSKQESRNTERPLEPCLFAGVVKKATHLIHHRLSIEGHKQVFTTLQNFVYWDQLELSSMFPALLPLLSETAVVISRRRKTTHHAAFLEHVAVCGIHKLDTPDLNEPQRRSITSTLTRIGLNFPTVEGTDRIIHSFSTLFGRPISSPMNGIQDLTVRIMVEEGCEDLFASAPLEFHSPLRFRAVMNCPNI